MHAKPNYRGNERRGRKANGTEADGKSMKKEPPAFAGGSGKQDENR